MDSSQQSQLYERIHRETHPYKMSRREIRIYCQGNPKQNNMMTHNGQPTGWTDPKQEFDDTDSDRELGSDHYEDCLHYNVPYFPREVREARAAASSAKFSAIIKSLNIRAILNPYPWRPEFGYTAPDPSSTPYRNDPESPTSVGSESRVSQVPGSQASRLPGSQESRLPGRMDGSQTRV